MSAAATINIGQQSVNIRGIGLIDSGGADDLTQGYRVDDIENIVLAQSNGVPIQVKDVAKVTVGYVPRLGNAGTRPRGRRGRRHRRHGPHPAHQRRGPAHQGGGREDQPRRHACRRASSSCRIYDRTTLVAVTTHTVLHNLVFGCLLVFVIQWMFLGDLRSAIIVGVNIPFALFFSHHHPGAARRGRQPAVGRRRRFRHHRRFRRDPGGEHFPQFPSRARQSRQPLLQQLAEGRLGRRSDRADHGRSAAIARWTDRLRLIFVSALQVDKAVFFSAAITVAAFVPLFTMQGVEGQIFGPMARTYGYALAGALLATFTVTPVLASLLLPEHIEEAETVVVRALRAVYTPVLRWALGTARSP